MSLVELRVADSISQRPDRSSVDFLPIGRCEINMQVHVCNTRSSNIDWEVCCSNSHDFTCADFQRAFEGADWTEQSV